MLARDLERLDPIARLQRVIAVRFEQIVEKFHIEVVVLDDQHLLGALMARREVPIHHFECHSVNLKWRR